MNDTAKASRITAAFKVIKRMNDGLSVSSTCKEVGLPRSSFYAIIDRGREKITEFQDLLAANNQEGLLLLLAKRNEILTTLLRDPLAETASHRD